MVARGPRATAALLGEFDMAATFTVEPALERLLDEPGLEALTLDLSAVRFVDSTGIGVLVRVDRRGAAARDRADHHTRLRPRCSASSRSRASPTSLPFSSSGAARPRRPPAAPSGAASGGRR